MDAMLCKSKKASDDAAPSNKRKFCGVEDDADAAVAADHLDVLKLLLSDEKVLEHADEDGRLPLHRAFETFPPVPFEVVKLLVDGNEKALKHEDKKGNLPLHWALEWQSTEDVVKLLVDRNEDAVFKRGIRGRLPLHIALENKASPGVVKLLIGKHNENVGKTFRGNMTPLHTALCHGWFHRFQRKLNI